MSHFKAVLLVFFLFLGSLLFARGALPAFSPPKEKIPARYSDAPMTNEIRGILLIPSHDYVDYCDYSGVCGLETHDVAVPGGLSCLAEILEPLFMNQTLTEDLLKCIKENIVLYYREHNHPVVAVYVPQQEIKHGVLQLVVLEGKVGQICCSNNKWFSSWIYESFLRLGPGDAITSDTLMTDVAWLNRNPFRDVDIVFTPGCDPGTTNIEFVTLERCPFQIYGGADNTGTSLSGTGRFFAGATWGNAFFLDHIASYQYTTALKREEFQSHTFHYTAPLPWQNLLILFGGYSTVEPDLDLRKSGGTAFEGSVRYVVPFDVNYNGCLKDISIGFDFKNYNNNLIFTSNEDVALITKSVNVTQFMAGYAYANETCSTRFSMNLDLFFSPGKLVSNQSQEDYEQLSPNSKVRYVYGKLSMGHTWFMLWDFSLYTLGRLQLASQNLLPSERFGIGGYDTVRGYKEREFLFDNALVVNVELRTPPVSFLQYFKDTNCCDEMYFLIFFDYGLGNINDRSGEAFKAFYPNLGKTEYFMGAGPGWRYTINRYLSARVDWGIKLHRTINSDSARSRWHAGFVLSY